MILWLAAAACGAVSASDYDLTAVRAARSFGFGEWAQAGALYELMLAERPGCASTYAHSIVAAELQPDTARSVALLERAMAHGVALDSVVDGVRSAAMACGRADVYDTFLRRTRRRLPYMARAIDARLLDYYEFRNDGAGMVALAESMLSGLPDSGRYLDALARGCMLQDDTAGAERAWRRLLDIEPSHLGALRSLGMLLHTLGRDAEARPLLERAQRIEPTPYIENILRGSYSAKQ